MSDRSSICTLNNGRKLGYIEYGDPRGTPIFFFHGWPGSRFSGRETDEAAKKLGIRVISTDRPGIGLSDFKPGRKLLDWPDDIVELADHLAINTFSVLGVSGGGPYAAACAYKIPDRIKNTGIVVGLAPVSVKSNLEGISFFGKLGWANYRRYPFVRYIAAFSAAIWFRYLPRTGTLMAFRSKEDRLLYQEKVKKQKESGEKGGTSEAFRQGIKGCAYELKLYSDDWGFDLKDIQIPVYLWYGAKDRSVSLKMGRYYRARIPHSTLYIDQDGGHLARYHFEDKILGRLVR